MVEEIKILIQNDADVFSQVIGYNRYSSKTKIKELLKNLSSIIQIQLSQKHE